MPTDHPRKTATYTPEIQEVVATLERHGCRPSTTELVMVGAETMLLRVIEQEKGEPDAEILAKRQRFLDLSGKPGIFDLDVAMRVRDEAWAR